MEREAQLKQGETAFCITDLFLEEAARLVFPSRCFWLLLKQPLLLVIVGKTKWAGGQFYKVRLDWFWPILVTRCN